VRSRLAREQEDALTQRGRARRRMAALLESAHAEQEHVRARVRTLSPQATLDRGYAVVRLPDGTVIREPDEASGTLRIRVARGEFDATVP
jgi:exodeoxyribonuclease VII large subunit